MGDWVGTSQQPIVWWIVILHVPGGLGGGGGGPGGGDGDGGGGGGDLPCKK